MKQQRLIILLNSLNGGGSEKVALTLIKYFDSIDLNLTLILLNREGVYLTEIPASVRIISLNWIFMRSGFLGRILAVWWIFINHSAKSVLAIGEWPNVIAPLSNWFLFKRKRIVISEHSTRTIVNAHQDYKRSYLDRRAALVAYDLADAIVAVSEEVNKSLAAVSPKLLDKTVVINNPIDVIDIDRLSKEQVSHPWFNEDNPLLISIGRLNQGKDHATLLKAVAQVLPQRQVRLILLGEGPLLKNLTDLINELKLSNHVDLLGFRSNPFPYLNNSDLYVHSSLYEGFPMVFAEAMACGLPVVTTNCNIPGELFNNHNNNRVVPLRDHQALSNAILEMLGQTHDKGAIRQSVQYLDVQKIGSTYQSVLFKNE